MGKNLFDKAAAKKAPAKAKKDDKERIVIAGKDFDTNLTTMADLTKKIKNLEAELELSKAVVKQVGIQEYIKLYEKLKRNPGSFNIVSESGSNVMVLASDRYIKCDETRAAELTEKYGEGIVKENTVFAFNTDLLNKYGEVISDLIGNCTEIADEDKDNLIVATTDFEVAKGTIDSAMVLTKDSVEDFIEDIKPVFALKNPQTK